MTLIDYLTNGLLESTTGKGRQILTFSGMYKDKDYAYALYLRIFEVMSTLFYPLALGLGFPIVMYFLAIEKEEQVKNLLEINGMKSRYYWLSTYTFFMLFLTLTSFVFYLSGFILLDDGFFHRIPVYDFIIFSILWNLNQIAISIFLISFINSSGTASAVGYFLSIVFTLFFVNVTQAVYVFPAKLPGIYRIFPIAMLTRIINYFLLLGDNMNTRSEDQEYRENMVALAMTACIYGLLGILFNEKRFQNKLIKVYKYIFRIRYNPNEIQQSSTIHESSRQIAEDIHSHAINYEDYAVACKDIDKVYSKNGKKFKALNNLNLLIEKGEIFGLLGPNGAGKTTLISIITSFIKRDSGEIYIDGEETISSNIKKKISLCPQFDILWSNLTVYEHFKFFGMMRGLSEDNLSHAIKNIARKVDLYESLHDNISTLSGGMRRRCSLGIALMGDVDIVFLDEPSTGLDPKKRRAFWKMIIDLQQSRTFVISTHLMEEAEFLCSKIGIISNGSLKATGNSAYLKKTFCNWKIIEITFEKYDEDVEQRLCERFNAKIEYRFNRLLKVRVDSEKNTYSELLEFLETYRGVIIKNWSVKKANLEDVFACIKETYV